MYVFCSFEVDTYVTRTSCAQHCVVAIIGTLVRFVLLPNSINYCAKKLQLCAGYNVPLAVHVHVT